MGRELKKIGIFGKTFNPLDEPYFNVLIASLREHKIDFCIEKNYSEILKKFKITEVTNFHTFTKDALENIEMLISWGGDGTILRAITFIKNTIPILGINTGRLGFLATVQKKEIPDAISLLKEQNFSIQKRSILQLNDTQNFDFKGFRYALNEVSITRNNSTSVVGIKVFLNQEYLTTYWADGLIIATPTGSTAYSLSCQGPIVIPSANNFIITPISPHNLNARPVVIPDDTLIELQVLSRSKNYLLSLDARCYNMEIQKNVTLQKADFSIHLVQLSQQSFLQTLRRKMFFGEDVRNK